MLLHLYGADSYRRSRAARDIVLKYQAKYPGGTVATFDCEEKDALDKLRTFAGASGLFAKVSLSIVYNPMAGEKSLVKFLKEMSDVPHATILAVADKKLPKDFAFLYEKGIGPAKNEFETLEGMEFLKFLKADAAEKDVRISDGQLKAIGELYAGDTWGAVTEIERVAFGGELAVKKVAVNFPAAMGALAGSGNLAARLKFLMLLLDFDDAAKIFNMVAAWARGEAKARFADYDIAIKSGALEYSEALLEYVLTTG